jgi:hypothetical protein
MDVAPDCNTFTTTGFNLHDLPTIRAQVREAVLFHAQDKSFNLFPNAFVCSHCGDPHALTPEQIKNGLFRGPGQVDFVASLNEFLAAINGIPAADVGKDFTNGVSRRTEINIDQVINPPEIAEPEPVSEEVPEDPNMIVEDPNVNSNEPEVTANAS